MLDASSRLTSGFGTKSHSWSVCSVWEIDTPLHAVLTLQVPSRIPSQYHRQHGRPTLYPQTAPTTPPAVGSISSPDHIGPAAYFPCRPQRAKVLQVYPIQMSTAQICSLRPRVDYFSRKIFPQPRRMQTSLLMNQPPVETMLGCLYLSSRWPTLLRNLPYIWMPTTTHPCYPHPLRSTLLHLHPFRIAAPRKSCGKLRARFRCGHSSPHQVPSNSVPEVSH